MYNRYINKTKELKMYYENANVDQVVECASSIADGFSNADEYIFQIFEDEISDADLAFISSSLEGTDYISFFDQLGNFKITKELL